MVRVLGSGPYTPPNFSGSPPWDMKQLIHNTHYNFINVSWLLAVPERN